MLLNLQHIHCLKDESPRDNSCMCKSQTGSCRLLATMIQYWPDKQETRHCADRVHECTQLVLNCRLSIALSYRDFRQDIGIERSTSTDSLRLCGWRYALQLLSVNKRDIAQLSTNKNGDLGAIRHAPRVQSFTLPTFNTSINGVQTRSRCAADSK